MWYAQQMAQDHDQSDFDFGFQPGIDTFAQGGVPYNRSSEIEHEQRLEDAQNAQPGSWLYAIAFVAVGCAIIALPYFF